MTKQTIAKAAPKPERPKEWFDDDDFWRLLYPMMFAEPRFASAETNLDKILALAAAKGKSVLDLACGPGRFAVPLARRGFAVTAVDRTPYLLSKARARARKAGVDIEWVRKDMRDFIRPEAFDLMLCMFTSFGYFDEKEEDVHVLENVFASLRPGGVGLIETMGKEILARIFLPTSSEEMPGGGVMFERREIRDNWTRVYNEWTILRNDQTRTFKFHHTIYSAEELREKLQRVGFVDVKLYGDLEGAAYDHKAQRLIITGRRPK